MSEEPKENKENENKVEEQQKAPTNEEEKKTA